MHLSDHCWILSVLRIITMTCMPFCEVPDRFQMATLADIIAALLHGVESTDIPFHRFDPSYVAKKWWSWEAVSGIWAQSVHLSSWHYPTSSRRYSSSVNMCLCEHLIRIAKSFIRNIASSMAKSENT